MERVESDRIQVISQFEWEFRDKQEIPLWAWLAGIIDGEGAIFLSDYKDPRRGYYGDKLLLAVQMTHEETIRKIQQITNVGQIHEYLPMSSSNRRISYRWSCYEQQAAAILRLCFPWLVTKRKHAEVALRFMDVKNQSSTSSGKRPSRGNPLPSSLIAQRQRLIQEMRQLQSGSGRRKKQKIQGNQEVNHD